MVGDVDEPGRPHEPRDRLPLILTVFDRKDSARSEQTLRRGYDGAHDGESVVVGEQRTCGLMVTDFRVEPICIGGRDVRRVSDDGVNSTIELPECVDNVTLMHGHSKSGVLDVLASPLDSHGVNVDSADPRTRDLLRDGERDRSRASA